MRYLFVLLLAAGLLPTEAQRTYTFKNWTYLRSANWSSLLWEPSTFVFKSHVRLRNRPEGYQPGTRCAKFVGMAYIDYIRASRQTLCAPSQTTSLRRISSARQVRGSRDVVDDVEISASQSTVDCFTAPYVPVGSSNKASISLCRSRNLVLNTCAFLAGKRKGTLTKKFPLPAPGAVQLGCDMVDTAELAGSDTEMQWLRSIHHDVWWANASRDDAAVGKACAPDSPTLVTTPTLFVMRDRHANYAHEMEVVSMAFSFLAALEPADVTREGIQVVIVDQAPPTGFLETWARISRPHRLRILAHDPFPPGTCFRSAFHVYTFAAGIGYNTNAETIRCESPVTTGLSHWLRQLYDERDPVQPLDTGTAAATAAAVTAGPAAAAAGVRGLRPPTGGIIMKNVVWLSRRNLELVRLLLNASVGWKSMRMVRNEDAVVAAILAAVQEWNAQSCLLQQFDRVVEEEYQKSLTEVHAVHGGAGEVTDAATKDHRRTTREKGHFRKAALRGPPREEEPDGEEDAAPTARPHAGGARSASRASSAAAALRLLAEGPAGGDIDEHGNDVADDDDDEEDVGQPGLMGSGAGGGGNGTWSSGDGEQKSGEGAAGQDGPYNRPEFPLGASTIDLNELWERDGRYKTCRRTNILFKFVDGDFNDMPYHQQLQIIFRTGVLVGVHGAGLTHGFFLPPGQSAVLQLLGESFAKVAANNVFRNMAVGVGNFYEDVLYSGVDVNVTVLKEAVMRAMDFVAKQTMDIQLRHTGGSIPLLLDDQSHFNIVVPSPDHCPRNRTQWFAARALQQEP